MHNSADLFEASFTSRKRSQTRKKMKFFAILLGMMTVSVHGAPTENGRPCKILPFRHKIFKDSLLLENKFECPAVGKSLHMTQFCDHVYKCPLDFDEKIRHCKAVCKDDGSWDYHYPACEDVIPLADEILHAIDNKKVLSDEIKLEQKDGMVRKKRSWTLTRPKIVKKEVEDEPAKLEVKPRVTRSVSLKKIRSLCQAKMCAVVHNKANTGCQLLDLLRTPDAPLQRRFCRICVKLDACTTQVKMLG